MLGLFILIMASLDCLFFEMNRLFCILTYFYHCVINSTFFRLKRSDIQCISIWCICLRNVCLYVSIVTVTLCVSFMHLICAPLQWHCAPSRWCAPHFGNLCPKTLILLDPGMQSNKSSHTNQFVYLSEPKIRFLSEGEGSFIHDRGRALTQRAQQSVQGFHSFPPLLSERSFWV